ncbi:MAG TPA: retropepsin-like aspartic protease, partial [Pyrinomonadaceae bacterium]
MRLQAASFTRLFALAACLLALSPAPRAGAQPTRGGRARHAAKAPRAAAPEFSFDSGGAAAKIPFELYANIPFVRARVNNSPPLWFMLDTGASGSLIDARRARRLGLKYLDTAKL